LNWWLSALLLALTALASVWPLLHAFFAEMNASLMADVPAFNVFAEINMIMPSLAGWRLEAALPTGLQDAVAGLGLVNMDQLTEWGMAAGAVLLSLTAFSARSWRLIYVPLLAVYTLAAGAILGGAEATLLITGGAIVLFMLGGLINRVRDAGRFNARVERLAEHVLRNPPQEGIRTADIAARKDPGDLLPAAAAATAIASAAAVAEGDEREAQPEAGAEDVADDSDAEAAEPGEDATNGEAEGGAEPDLPPAVDDADEAPADTEAAVPDHAGDAEAGGEAGVTDSGDVPEALSQDDAPEAAADVDTDQQAGGEPAAEASDDDLPSLDAVAAAAALSAAEQGGDDMPADDGEAARENVALDDERTMPLASPPPMPAADEPAVTDEAETADKTPEPQASAETAASESGTADAEDEPEPQTQATALADVESRVEDAVNSAGGEAPQAGSIVDDPMMEDGPDPMLPETQAGDPAPGAPDVDVEPDTVD
jgi:Na+-transporting methylmalonyl-CoA/oxaloacetate decarboxylase gamma subunit